MANYVCMCVDDAKRLMFLNLNTLKTKMLFSNLKVGQYPSAAVTSINIGYTEACNTLDMKI